MRYALRAFFALALVVVLCSSTRCSASDADDLAAIRTRYALSVLPRDPAAIQALHARSAKFAASLRNDGSWADVDYGDTTKPFWAITEHLQRALVMAKSARISRDAGAPDLALEQKIATAYRWWSSHDYQNHLNPALWWWNEIGVPELIGEGANLVWAQLPADEVARLAAILRRADWQHGPAARSIGANLIWKATIGVARGCLENNPQIVGEAYRRLYEEVKVVGPTEEGIQHDSSFHQHGLQLYSGGYGLTYANDVSRFVSFAWGTRFQIPADRMAILSAYLLDGEQWMIRGIVFDYSTVGREIARPGKLATPASRGSGPISPAGAEYSLGNVVALLAAQPTPRQREFQAFAARLNRHPGATELEGNKQFWDSDYMVHRRNGFMASVKMMSTRIQNGELINGEGGKSAHLSDGVNLLYRTGDEYRDIFPVWDWTLPPGSTTIQSLETGEKNPIAAFSPTTFNGGVSDGHYGMAAMSLERGHLTAQKVWFFFDAGYVALGAGITLSDDAVHQPATGVNQALLHGAVLTGSDSRPIEPGTRTYNTDRPLWIYHDRIGYVFPAHQRILLKTEEQTGRWTDFGFAGSTDLLSIPVFNLSIQHGNAPKEAQYAYFVYPEVSSMKLAELAAHPPMEVLANSPLLQAVYGKDQHLLQAAFRAPGTLASPLGAVEADRACLLLVRALGAHGWQLTASNPDNLPLTLHVKVAGHAATLELPGGAMAGSSISILLPATRSTAAKR